MPLIHVCPLAQLEAVVATTGASHLVSLLSANTPVTPPRMIPADRRLSISVSDIAEPIKGHILPQEEHVAPIIAFVRAWPRERPLVIHCWAGISRSTAAAFVSVCALAPHREEIEIAQALRAASPSATPNPRIVAVADALLGRSGRMIGAVQRIGRGAEASCGEPFQLKID
ncbi:MAG: protein tyrosine phosphatase [Salinarimonadaceae bacterium]|nr:MAG: protein tyrosine phosphatase [Salinarimonadaceae bacterium]